MQRVAGLAACGLSNPAALAVVYGIGYTVQVPSTQQPQKQWSILSVNQHVSRQPSAVSFQPVLGYMAIRPS